MERILLFLGGRIVSLGIFGVTGRWCTLGTLILSEPFGLRGSTLSDFVPSSFFHLEFSMPPDVGSGGWGEKCTIAGELTMGPDDVVIGRPPSFFLAVQLSLAGWQTHERSSLIRWGSHRWRGTD